MKLRGKVKGGVVVLEAGASLPDGLEVYVEAAESTSGSLGELTSTCMAWPANDAPVHRRLLPGMPGTTHIGRPRGTLCL